jgi:hypothetical protein
MAGRHSLPRIIRGTQRSSGRRAWFFGDSRLKLAIINGSPAAEAHMNEQLQEIVDGFESALGRIHRLAGSSTAEEWRRRPQSGGWSAAECIAHLNITSEAFLPLLRKGIEEADVAPSQGTRRYRRDLVGWVLGLALKPGGRIRSATAPSFIPQNAAEREVLVPEFERLQFEQIECVKSADGRMIDRVKIGSPFDPRLRYTVFSALTILPIHQHRHLLQAERAIESLSE